MGSEGEDAKETTAAAKKRRRVEEKGGEQAFSASSAAAQSEDEVVPSSLAESEMVMKKAAEGWDAAAKAYARLQAEVKRLKKDLETAKQQVEEQKATSAKELAAQKDVSDDLVTELEKERRKLTEAAAAGKRKAEEGNRFHYVLARTGQAGSIPRSFLESDADSLLNKMFNGDWDYARDEQGRALLNCNPEDWAAILNFQTTGTLPVERNQGLLDQARHWNLKQLVQTLEALTPGVTVTQHPDGNGLIARCNFTKVAGLLDKEDGFELRFSDPENRVMWAVLVQPRGIYLCLRLGEDRLDKKKVCCTMRIMLQNCVLEKKFNMVELEEGGNRGFNFANWGYSHNQLASEPLAIAHDCIVVEMDLSYNC